MISIRSQYLIEFKTNSIPRDRIKESITVSLKGVRCRSGGETTADHGDGGGGERRVQHRRRDRQLHADPHVEKKSVGQKIKSLVFPLG